MCFSEKVDKMAVGQIEVTQRRVLAAFNEIHDFSYFPKITKLMFRKLWNRLVALRLRQEDVFIPLNKEEDGYALPQPGHAPPQVLRGQSVEESSEWKPMEGEVADLSEIRELKHPLQSWIISRNK
ncbi:hypothetical protein OPV22_032240 [Ensete ventricosum]|uniref:Uncharacterized protein n=1 Tax=Ensete ventricosum TaxID=4639 RepID=A0AAV8PYQ0_ENSVE|nr:hypothetical protein OPV22_032240 [Ensete ventricosum]